MRMTRVRTFLTLFMGCSKSADSEELPDAEAVTHFTMLISKLNACVNHLEQFPIKMYDVASGPPGVRSAGSTLKFFKTHHLSLDCTSLKSWKGGLVKIDPLALVRAIERYLSGTIDSLLYIIIMFCISDPRLGKPSDRDSGSDDEDMSDDGQEDTLNNTSREKGSEAGHQRLEFVMGDTALPRDMTVYQASSINQSEPSIVSN